MKLPNAASRKQIEVPEPRQALHLGCGDSPLPGYINVDFHNPRQADLITDLSKKWPWADQSTDLIVAHHLIEHLPDVVHFMNEAHRVLRPEGLLHLAVPHYRHPNAWSDPTHVRAFTPASMDPFTHQASHKLGLPWDILDQWVEGGYQPPLRLPRLRPGEIQWLMTPRKQ